MPVQWYTGTVPGLDQAAQAYVIATLQRYQGCTRPTRHILTPEGGYQPLTVDARGSTELNYFKARA